MNKRQRNKLFKKRMFASLSRIIGENKKQTANGLWLELKHLGGSKKDTYAQALINYGHCEYLEFYRVRESFEGMDSEFLWLQTASDVELQKIMKKRNILNGGAGTPMTKNEIRIIWKNGKLI